VSASVRPQLVGVIEMITGAAFIGKLIEFLATKLLGKRLDLALDDKKRACRAFIDLYESISKLELITGTIVSKLELIVQNKKDRIYSRWLEELSPQVDATSVDVLRSIDSLGPVVSLFDPDLAALFSRLVEGKKGMFFYVPSVSVRSFRFEIKWKESTPPARSKSLEAIKYTKLSREVTLDDLEGAYAGIKKLAGIPKVKWPRDVLSALIQDNLTEDYINPTDKTKIKELYDALRTHREVLIQAREKLGEFVKNRFSIEDLLYVMK
jgi:hypothetical protein